ncbi:serine protein kinase RIO [Photobacterium phosphoreum]|jgi:RIO kinase 1|uniref:non-specific serine/threonine protein kinase n=1 Tax=Photobacterium phosphoreum TaxID=659 RepID=A0AAW5A2W7_PHOPO|nr:PA4780 family RIO1-like protein kinase [Photobacterium phosphoreum]KJF87793.1 kinase [Photobacterium phosphoreum]MCD9464496.1 serine protein kinase RIO [Photobacterium phosphoreum]MCD9475482.1 serine protein kinase RIO [Photobacterium phosphoreum]MCD9480046.1 serine protein kinase RIO [Photobacterium phosphoreum]MCD9484434.1 serine protein kinase RIO [Photobacterium phosphoreum]
MKIPPRLQPLVEDGLVDDVLSQLMSGKEASVYVVRSGGKICCAKVYKEIDQRSFKKAVTYREGRKVRNSRRARAMEKGSKFGRDEQEKVWQQAEVDALSLLLKADVRAPIPYGCFDGVLLMELITDADGAVAPRLNDITLTKEQALRDHALMIKYIKRMLCIGLIHGDLSEFNVLVDGQGPVIIDLPQAVDASANNNAKWMFERDVNNMAQYYGRYAPEVLETQYGKEMWALFQAGTLTPETELTGVYIESEIDADIDGLMAEINAVMAEAELRRARFMDEINEDEGE